MPPFNFYRRRWYPNRRWRWRRRTRIWRPRQTIRRRFRRRRWVRRRRRYRKYNKKLKSIHLKEWQPQTIRKCKIKGNLCLLTCGRQRTNHNYILTSESIVPQGEPGGGGWSILQFTPRVLYDEYIHFQNWWTKGNEGLPLTKYLGCTIKFYRSQHTSYIVTPQTCPPFEVTEDIYLNTQPIRRLMDRKSFIVPQLGRGPLKKTYIKKRFYPPSLLKNKWYFSQDIYNTPLLVLSTSLCSFDEMYAPDDQISTNITLVTLNTRLFQIPNYKTIPYQCSTTATQGTYLFGEDIHAQNDGPKWNNLILLGQLSQWQQGEKISNDQFQKMKSGDLTGLDKTKMGNPFVWHWNSKDSKIFYGPMPTNSANLTDKANVTEITGLYQFCRYNPQKDKAKGNKVYWKPTDTTQGSLLTLPTDSRLIITDFPLWLIFWGWEDWILKSKPITHLHEEYQLVIQSDYIYPKMPCYVILDPYFYLHKSQDHMEDLTETDKAHWHPRYAYQIYATEAIANTGPGTPKLNHVKQMQAHCNYTFHFKWGGCPAPMEIIKDPAKQEKYPTPCNLTGEYEIEDPENSKEHFLYRWDERQGYLTGKARERLSKDYKTPIFVTEFGAKDIQLQTQKKEDETSDTETEKETSKQLIRLRKHRDHLKRRIKRLLKSPKLFPIL
nr:MAG: ORF1 [TTV-like mini virus]